MTHDDFPLPPKRPSGYPPPPSRNAGGGCAPMTTTQPPNDPPTDGFRSSPAWLLAAAAVVVAQAGLALALFGPGRPWLAVTDERPVLSGRHPLHLYHGTLGAAAFRHS